MSQSRSFADWENSGRVAVLITGTIKPKDMAATTTAHLESRGLYSRGHGNSRSRGQQGGRGRRTLGGAPLMGKGVLPRPCAGVEIGCAAGRLRHTHPRSVTSPISAPTCKDEACASSRPRRGGRFLRLFALPRRRPLAPCDAGVPSAAFPVAADVRGAPPPCAASVATAWMAASSVARETLQRAA